MKKTFKFFYYFYMLTKKGNDPWNCSPPDIARKLVVVPSKLVVTGWQSCKKCIQKMVSFQPVLAARNNLILKDLRCECVSVE